MNIRHRVTHIRQVNRVSCWHACLQMVFGRRHVRPLGSSVYAPFLMPNGTLNPSETNLQNFATRFGFVKKAHRVYPISELTGLLQGSPIIILGNWYAGLHAYVMSGITGDGTENNTYVILNNPNHRTRDEYPYGFFIQQFQNGPFGILKPRRWSAR